MAILKTHRDTIACYGVRFGGSKNLMVANTVVDNQLQNCFDANPSEHQSLRHVIIGNGRYSAVYSVTCKYPSYTATMINNNNNKDNDKDNGNDNNNKNSNNKNCDDDNTD